MIPRHVQLQSGSQQQGTVESGRAPPRAALGEGPTRTSAHARVTAPSAGQDCRKCQAGSCVSAGAAAVPCAGPVLSVKVLLWLPVGSL